MHKKITRVKFCDIDHSDSPHYSDASISYAEIDGRKLTESELDELNKDRDFVYEQLMNFLN